MIPTKTGNLISFSITLASDGDWRVRCNLFAVFLALLLPVSVFAQETVPPTVLPTPVSPSETSGTKDSESVPGISNTPGVSQTTAVQPVLRSPSETRGEELSAFHHPWGRFAPQSWVRMKTTTITSPNDRRRTVNHDETKIALESIDENSITLSQISYVTMGGKKIESNPITQRYDFFQELIREGTTISSRPPANIMIGRRIVPCYVRLYENDTPDGKRRTIVYYSHLIEPYVLRVDKTLWSIPTKERPEARMLSQTITNVIETSALSNVPNARKGYVTYRLSSVKKSGGITTVTNTSCSRQVPGGVIREKMSEYDANWRELRYSETYLIDPGVSAVNGQPGNNFQEPSAMVPSLDSGQMLNGPQGGASMYPEPYSLPRFRGRRYYPVFPLPVEPPKQIMQSPHFTPPKDMP